MAKIHVGAGYGSGDFRRGQRQRQCWKSSPNRAGYRRRVNIQKKHTRPTQTNPQGALLKLTNQLLMLLPVTQLQGSYQGERRADS